MSTLMKDGCLLEDCKMRLGLCWWALASCRMAVAYRGEGLALRVADMKLVACKWDPPLLELQVQVLQWRLAEASE